MEKNEMKSRNIRSFFIATLVFVIFSSLSIFIWQQVNKSIKKELEIQFEIGVNETIIQMEDKLENYINLLFSLRALFSASVNVERHEWNEYIAALNINERLPGIQALEFISRVDNSKKELFIQQVRDEGYTDFIIHPKGNKKEYLVVNYIQPIIGNEPAFGFDLASNAIRKEALYQARDSNKPIVTAPIKLIQEKDEQSGFLIMLPVYSNGMMIDTVDERRKALIGYVLAVFRSNDLFINALHNISIFKNIHLDVIDEEVLLDNENILFTHQHKKDEYQAEFSEKRIINIAGRKWIFSFHELSGFSYADKGKMLPFISLGVGFTISFLISWLFFSYSRTKVKSMLLSEKITKDYKKSSKEAQESKIETEKALREAQESKSTLERLNLSMTGRELKMIELKEEIKRLKKEEKSDSIE